MRKKSQHEEGITICILFVLALTGKVTSTYASYGCKYIVCAILGICFFPPDSDRSSRPQFRNNKSIEKSSKKRNLFFSCFKHKFSGAKAHFACYIPAMKRRRVDGEEEEQEKEEKVMSPIDFIRASISKGETQLYEWETAVGALNNEAQLWAIRGELAKNLPNLFKGNPLEDLVTSPGKITLVSFGKLEAADRDDTTYVYGSISLLLGIDEELNAKRYAEKEEKEKEKLAGELSVHFDVSFCEDRWSRIELKLDHCGTSVTLQGNCRVPYLEHCIVDGAEFLKFLKSRGLCLPSSPGKNEMSIMRCLIWLLKYIISKCICDGHYEVDYGRLTKKLHSEMLKPAGEEARSTMPCLPQEAELIQFQIGRAHV